MAEIASAFVSLMPSAKGFGRKLESEVGGEVDKSGKKAGGVFGKAFGAVAAVGAAAGVASFAKTGITDARNYAKAFEATEAIIKATGGAANVTANDVGKMSGRLEQLTGVDDEVIQKSANLLLTFKNVRNEVGKGNDMFTRANKAALDLSAAGFGSVESQAKALGKALNDPLKGITALSRSGVTFTAQQQEQIKALASTGQNLKAQKIIMAEVEAQVGGVAESQVTAADRAAVAWDNLRQQFGALLLPVIDSVSAAFVKIAPAISSGIAGIGPAFTSARSFVEPFIASFRDQMLPIIRQFASFVTGTALPALTTFGRILVANKDVLIAAAAGLVAAKVAMVAYAAYTKVVTVVTKAWAVAQKILNGTLKANPIGLVITAIALLVAGFVLAYKRSETFRGIVNKVASVLKGTVMPVVTKFAGIVGGALVAAVGFAISIVAKIIGKVIEFGGALVKAVAKAGEFLSGVKAKIEAAFNFIKSIPGKVTAVFSGAGTLLLNAGRQLMEGLAAGISEKINAAIDKVKDGLAKIKGLLPGSPIKWGPLKNWNNGGAGKRLMALVAKGITEATPKTVKAAQSAFEKIADKLAATRDNLKGTLDGLKGDFASLSDSVANAFTGNLFDVSSTLADDGSVVKTVGQNFVEGLMGKKAELTGLMASFKTLQGWGLDPAFLSQLFASGQGALITELAGMGQAGATSAASLFGEVTDLGNQLGNAVASNDPVTDRIDETNRLLGIAVNQLEFLDKNIGKQLNGAASKARRSQKNRGKK